MMDVATYLIGGTIFGSIFAENMRPQQMPMRAPEGLYKRNGRLDLHYRVI
jgi:hypothetical protein